MSELPSSWVLVKIRDVIELSNAKGNEGIIPYLEIGNIDTKNKTYQLTDKPSVKGCRQAYFGDVLISRVRPTRGAIVKIKEEIPVSPAFSVLRDYQLFSDGYLFNYLAWNRDFLNYLGENCTGTMYPTTSDEVVGEYEIVIAPHNEQKRIVSKIEELFSEIDAGAEALKRVETNLKRYRASVLKAACEGKLVPTEAELAKKEGREYEHASLLLERILKGRREKWQKENPGKKYKEPKAPDTKDLPELPEGWVWTSLGYAFDVRVGATPRRNESKYWGGDIPWVSSGEVAFCRIKRTKETISEAGYKNSSTTIHPIGTVLIGMIGEGKTRGQVAILDVQATHNQNSAAIRVSDTEVVPEYIYYFLQGQYEETRRAGSGNNQPALNKQRVMDIIFPLPPIREQHRIVAEADKLSSVIDKLKVTIAQIQSDGLKQSLLKKAFSGQLVPQDPNDEPASVLLERIEEERAKREVEAKATITRKPKAKKKTS